MTLTVSLMGINSRFSFALACEVIEGLNPIGK